MATVNFLQTLDFLVTFLLGYLGLCSVCIVLWIKRIAQVWDVHGFHGCEMVMRHFKF
jgi:hypothetical protein